jgi:hypothetical protein
MVRELVRQAGDHVIYQSIKGKGRRTVGVVLWLEPAEFGSLSVMMGRFNRQEERKWSSGFVISHHAISRLYRRLGTTDLGAVTKTLAGGLNSLIGAIRDGRLLSGPVAVPVADGGHLIFEGKKANWCATTYLAPGMEVAPTTPVLDNQTTYQ